MRALWDAFCVAVGGLAVVKGIVSVGEGYAYLGTLLILTGIGLVATTALLIKRRRELPGDDYQ